MTSAKRADETTSLLSPSDQDQDRQEQQAASNSPDTSTRSSWSRTQYRAMVVGSIIMLMVDFGIFLGAAPQIQIFQEIICDTYYAKLNQVPLFNETRCLAEPIQSELALVLGLKNTFDSLPGILLGIPYGVMADRIGRKQVLILAILGTQLGEVWSRAVCKYLQPYAMCWP
jgi:MFS family permease